MAPLLNKYYWNEVTLIGQNLNNFVIARGTIFEYIELDGPAQGNKREAENFKILSQKFLIY